MPWIGPAIGLAGSLISGGNQQQSNYQAPSFYQPTGLGSVDASWQNAYSQAAGATNQGAAAANPLYAQTLAQQQAINYQPWQQAANQAGQQYGQLANFAGQQGQQYGQMAGQALGQQANLYGMANQVGQTAFDPQNALYGRTQQQLTDQVRAGQAARGLGNSAVGAAEENQAMGNFNIDWQNQQLQRQTQGMSAMAQGSSAGGAQGQLAGADMSAQQGAYAAIPGYTQQAGQTPIQGQQYVAGQPAAAGQQYQQNMANTASMYNQQMNQAIPYMNQGMGATNAAYGAFQGQQQQQNMQNQAMGNVWGNVGGLVNQSGAGQWLNNNIFGGGGNVSGSMSGGGYNPGYDPGSAAGYYAPV